MRKIKFRAWDGNKMYYPDFVELGINSWNDQQSIAFTPENWSGGMLTTAYFDQYTGLKDKNGKEIYEGDIVKFSDGKIAEIVFWQSGFNIKQSTKYSFHTSQLCMHHAVCEIIGNIHENPELLEG